MSRVLTQSINVTCLAPGKRNGSRHQRKESEKSPRSVKMMCHTLRASGFISMSGFSGLRTVNPLDTTTNTIMQRPTLQYFYYSKVPSSGSGAIRRCGRRCVPNAMFEHFTEKANKVIILAKEESRRLNHNFVGTEQILLGLIGERTGIAAKVLKNMGIKLEDARMKVEKFIGRGSEFVAVDIPFTPRAWHVMELSLEEARQLEHNYIGTEHLLLGLLREEEGVAAHVLKRLGVHDPTKIRTQVIRMVTGKSTDDSVNIMPTLSTNLTKLADEVFGIVTDESTDDSVNKMPTLSPNLTKLVEEVTRMVTSESTDGSVKKMSTSEEYSTNLTKLAEEGKLDPVVGRQQQIERVTQILLRNTKNNPCLIGLPGVGKTAIVKALAQRIANGDVPESIKGKKVVTLETGLLVAGTKSRGEFEKRLKKIIEEIKQRDDIILFIDEVHTVIEAGSAEAANDAANILKPALARGELQCIGATTLDEYKKHIEKDPALERRFQPIEVPEPTVDETIQILKGLKEHYETHHELRYTDEALVTAATLSYQYISDRFLPDKAIDLVDEAGSQVRLRHAKGHAQLLKEAREQDEEVRQIVKEKEEAVRNQDFGKAIQLRDRERDSKAQMSALVEKYKEMRRAENEAGGPFVTKADIQHIVSSWTGIPVEKVSTSD